MLPAFRTWYVWSLITYMLIISMKAFKPNVVFMLHTFSWIFLVLFVRKSCESEVFLKIFRQSYVTQFHIYSLLQIRLIVRIFFCSNFYGCIVHMVEINNINLISWNYVLKCKVLPITLRICLELLNFGRLSRSFICFPLLFLHFYMDLFILDYLFRLVCDIFRASDFHLRLWFVQKVLHFAYLLH